MTSDLVQIDSVNHTKNLSEDKKVVLMTLSIEEEKRAEFKSWCARNRLKMNEAFIKGFDLLKEKYGL
ncbi:MAG TPA: hypothetical protein LFV92_07820 [Rickettsia endosymbiont of Ceroptres masudai]|nr:hypothetical protein [Rickettsia endosymbiont of Ceroptres masudai]